MLTLSVAPRISYVSCFINISLYELIGVRAAVVWGFLSFKMMAWLIFKLLSVASYRWLKWFEWNTSYSWYLKIHAFLEASCLIWIIKCFSFCPSQLLQSSSKSWSILVASNPWSLPSLPSIYFSFSLMHYFVSSWLPRLAHCVQLTMWVFPYLFEHSSIPSSSLIDGWVHCFGFPWTLFWIRKSIEP